MEPQFNDSQRTAAINLLESHAWGSIEWELTALEAALALALEAVADIIGRWEEEGEDRFGDEFTLSAEQVASLDDEWRLAYVARLLDAVAVDYGVSPYSPRPGRQRRPHDLTGFVERSARLDREPASRTQRHPVRAAPGVVRGL